MTKLVLLLVVPIAALGADLDELANSLPWKKLIHFESGRSSVEVLRDTLRDFQKSETLADDHARCRYPARFQWLSTKLDLSHAPKPECKRWQAYRETMPGNSVSLVFSSYHPGNPVSAFGHTFLKIDDYGISFAAVLTTRNPLIYAFKGVFGLFDGKFTRVPYFYKIRDYNDVESRDLWEYELNLTADEKARLVAHTWELSQASFPYYYLGRNCSYEINAIVEAAAPRFELTAPLAFYVIPGDTVRLFKATPGLVDKITYLPSLGHRTDPLDVAQAQGRDLQPLLEERARLPASEEKPVEVPWGKAPHVGHGSARIGIEQGISYTGASFRFALHDLLDPSDGYPDTQIEIANVRARYVWGEHEFQLDELTVVSANALSWKFKLNAATQRDESCDHCVAGGFEIGVGLSTPSAPLVVFTTLDVESYFSPRFDRSAFRLGGGPSVGIRFAPTSRLNLLAGAHYKYRFPTESHHDLRAEAGMRWSVFDDFALDLGFRRYPREWEASSGFYYYF